MRDHDLQLERIHASKAGTRAQAQPTTSVGSVYHQYTSSVLEEEALIGCDSSEATPDLRTRGLWQAELDREFVYARPDKCSGMSCEIFQDAF